jgi:hypothetical protein
MDKGELVDDAESFDKAYQNNIIHTAQQHFEQLEPFLEETRREIIHLSPCLGILDNLREGRINIDGLHWRELEELIAELLEKDG